MSYTATLSNFAVEYHLEPAMLIDIGWMWFSRCQASELMYLAVKHAGCDDPKMEMKPGMDISAKGVVYKSLSLSIYVYIYL